MWLKRNQLAPGSKFRTPYYIARGRAKGKTVMITAGVHGNERASVRAAQKLLDELRNDRLAIRRGKLIVVPLVNRAAYKKKIRGVPDLNRTFPRRPGGAARHPLSAALLRLAKRHRPAWYIDLHEANGLSRLNRHVLGQTIIASPGSKAVYPVRRVIDRMNRSIVPKSRRFTAKVHHLSGSGRSAADRLLRSRSITVETCWSLRFADRLKYQSRIVRLLLREAGCLS